MAKQTKREKSNFIVQGSILAAASIICRLIGIVYRIPLTNIIGDEGNGYYSCAFEVYSMLLLISSYSLPTAVSKLVASRNAKGQKKNAYKIYKCALIFALTVGIIVSIVTYFGADIMAGSMMNQPMSAIALRVLAPAIFIVAIMGVMRGYYQGLGTMMPTVFSQVIEQIINAIVSIAAAAYLYNYGKKIDNLLYTKSYASAYGAAGGTLGTVFGALFGMLFLIFVSMGYKRVIQKQIRKDKSGIRESYAQIFPVLIMTIMPIIFSTAVYNISGIVDQAVFNHILENQGVSSSARSSLWGIYSGKYKLLTNVPVALANALASSTVPALTAAIAHRDDEMVSFRISSSIKFTMLLVIPCAVGFTVLASPILQLLFNDSRQLPAKLLMVGSVSVVFYSLSTLSNGILQGINKMNIPVRNAIISLIIHIICLVAMLFAGWGVYAVVYANIIFALIMCILNNLAISKNVKYAQEFKKTFLIPLLSALIMGIVVFGAYKLFFLILNNSISCLLSIGIGAVVYFVTLLLLKGVSEEELIEMPMGLRIIRIAKKFRLL